jgi:uncharacterized protein YuzE
LYISFSDEDKKGIILDYSAGGSIVGIEILNTSKQTENPAKVEYEFAFFLIRKKSANLLIRG